MTEEVVTFGANRSLVGVLTYPIDASTGSNHPAMLFLNSGIVHRVGMNRLHVKLARDLAKTGVVSFRFDFSGVGDSAVCRDTGSIEGRWVRETIEAINYLSQEKGIERFVIIGNCSGAYAALKAACRDRRVVGTVLIQLQGDSIHPSYYWRLLFIRKAWLRVITGKAKFEWFTGAMKWSVGKFWKARHKVARELDYSVAYLNDMSALCERGVRLLLVYCEWDPGLYYYRAKLRDQIRQLSGQGQIEVEIIPGVNHDFYLLAGQRHLMRTVRSWVMRHMDFGPPPNAVPGDARRGFARLANSRTLRQMYP